MVTTMADDLVKEGTPKSLFKSLGLATFLRGEKRREGEEEEEVEQDKEEEEEEEEE